MKAHKYLDFSRTVVIATNLSLLALTESPLQAGPADKEKFHVPTSPSVIAFPARPEGASETLTVSSPVLVIDESVASKLGGATLEKMARPQLENMLNNSGRFTVLLDGDAPYKIKATVTSLKITQTHARKGAGAAQVFKTLIPKLAGNNKIDPALADLMTADWSKDEVVMKVECGISMQITDKDSRLIVGNTGLVTRETTTAAIRAELGGIAVANGAVQGSGGSLDPPTLDVDFPSKLIELAAYESLKQSIPAIDREISARKISPTIVTKPKESAEPNRR